MGYNLVNWHPSVTTGTNTNSDLDVPGSTGLNGSMTTGNPCPVLNGDSSMFPNYITGTPTIAQINASSDWNQVIATLNRRIQNQVNNFHPNFSIGTPYSTLPYLPTPATPGQPVFGASSHVTAAYIKNIQSVINALRANEGFQPFVFTAFVAQSFKAGGKNASIILGKHIAECRKALRIAGQKTLSIIVPGQNLYYCVKAGQYTRQDHPYGTPVSEVYQAEFFDSMAFPETTVQQVGKQYTGATTDNMNRYREYFQFPVPDYVTAAGANTFTSTLFYGLGNPSFGTPAFTGQIWTSNTDDSALTQTPPFGGFIYNCTALTATLSGTWSSVHGSGFSSSVVLPQATIVAKASQRICFVVGTNDELSQTGSSTQSGIDNFWCGFPVGSTPNFVLDFGV